jgi:homocysteine S-methyltransferase
MGTMLYSRGVFINRCYDELNVSAPDLVREIHQDYVRAGAEILETNTFGAYRVRLRAFGKAEKLEAINRAGVRLAREAAGRSAFVAGAIGPLGARLEPLGPTSFAEARAVFREHAGILADEGADLIILETFANLDELREAVAGVREAAGTGLALVAQVTIDDFGNLPGGAVDTETFTAAIEALDVDVIGCNCSTGPRATFETIEKMAAVAAKPLSAMPNAGLPSRVEGRNIYLCSPEYMAQYARRFLSAGVRIFSGCCGTTPEHIKAVCAEVRSLRPGRTVVSVAAGAREAHPQALAKVPLAG